MTGIGNACQYDCTFYSVFVCLVYNVLRIYCDNCRLQVVSTNVGGVPEVLPPHLIRLAEPSAKGQAYSSLSIKYCTQFLILHPALLACIAGTACGARWGLLLQMLHIAWSVCVPACVCVCVGHTSEPCKKQLRYFDNKLPVI